MKETVYKEYLNKFDYRLKLVLQHMNLSVLLMINKDNQYFKIIRNKLSDHSQSIDSYMFLFSYSIIVFHDTYDK